MKRKKGMVLWFIFAVILMFGSISVCAAEKGTDSKTSASVKKSKSGWFTKGKYRYYRGTDGKLYKNVTKQIGKYTYRFDKKGRLVTGAVKTKNKYVNRTDYYNKKTGRYEYSVMRLKVLAIEKTAIIAKYGNEEYVVSGKAKFYNKKGKKISFSSLKKGQQIDVYYNGEILETYPAIITGIKKVCLV